MIFPDKIRALHQMNPERDGETLRSLYKQSKHGIIGSITFLMLVAPYLILKTIFLLPNVLPLFFSLIILGLSVYIVTKYFKSLRILKRHDDKETLLKVNKEIRRSTTLFLPFFIIIYSILNEVLDKDLTFDNLSLSLFYPKILFNLIGAILILIVTYSVYKETINQIERLKL